MSFEYNWPEHSLKNETTTTKNISQKKTISNDSPEKQQKLNELKQKMQNEDKINFKNLAKNFVFSDGDCNAKIMLIGEAPGQEEDEQGFPFVGKSGKLLRYFMKEAKILNYYITNIIPWRPPNNRTPTPEEIQAMQPYVFEHIKIIQPKIIVAVGSTALKGLNITENITKAQGNIFHTQLGTIFAIFHPSYALRVSSKKKDLWQSLLKLHLEINSFT